MSEIPHWERGMRGHGYWLGTQRLGYVSLPPRGYKAMGGLLIYSWGVDGLRGATWEGTARRLDTAKRAVERAVARLRTTAQPEEWPEDWAAREARYDAFCSAISGFQGLNIGSMQEFTAEFGVSLDDPALAAHLVAAGWIHEAGADDALGGVYWRGYTTTENKERNGTPH